jgi:hypothetical protein
MRPILDGNISRTGATIDVVITPVEQQTWTLSAFAILLNELDSTWDHDGRICSVEKHISADHSSFYLHTLFQCENTALPRLLAVKSFPGDWSIDLEASREWIVTEWEPLEIMRKSTKNPVKISREAPEGTPTHLTGLKNLAIKNITRFSRSRNREEIKRYVEENFVFGSEFALGLSISVFDMVSSGTRHFKT